VIARYVPIGTGMAIGIGGAMEIAIATTTIAIATRMIAGGIRIDTATTIIAFTGGR
jgi:hypothetical protein